MIFFITPCTKTLIVFFQMMCVCVCVLCVNHAPCLSLIGKKMSGRNRITFMLLSVVLVFLICITPDAIMSTFFGYGYVEENFLVKGRRGEAWVLFVGPPIPLFQTSSEVCPWFQVKERFPHGLSHLHAIYFSDSPLVLHLLTSWRPVWQ